MLWCDAIIIRNRIVKRNLYGNTTKHRRKQRDKGMGRQEGNSNPGLLLLNRERLQHTAWDVLVQKKQSESPFTCHGKKNLLVDRIPETTRRFRIYCGRSMSPEEPEGAVWSGRRETSISMSGADIADSCDCSGNPI
jgi:hypothetical protein